MLSFAVILSGCATCEPVIKTVIQTVEVPVSIPCKTEIPVKPEFNFDSINENQDIFDKTKALLADRKLHIGYEGELEAALKSCK